MATGNAGEWTRYTEHAAAENLEEDEEAHGEEEDDAGVATLAAQQQ